MRLAVTGCDVAQVRSLSVLEGIALASDPNYKVLGAAYPWIARRLLTDRSPELKVRPINPERQILLDTLYFALYRSVRNCSGSSLHVLARPHGNTTSPPSWTCIMSL